MKMIPFPTHRRSPEDVICGAVRVLLQSDRPRDIAFVAALLENLEDGIKHGQIDGYSLTAAWDALPIDVGRLGSHGPKAS